MSIRAWLSIGTRVSLLGCLVAALFAAPLWAQPRAVLADSSGPWSNAQWTFTVSQFSALLHDAGYSVAVVSPADLASALNDPNILLAVPSLESLPFDAFKAIASHVNAGGGLMASGGEPFRNPLYLAPDGRWLDAAAYLQAVGSPPQQGAFQRPYIPTLSPSKEQFTASSGLRIPIPRGRGIFSVNFSGRYRVIGDLFSPAATLYLNQTSVFSPPSAARGESLVAWLPWPQLPEPLRAQLVAALRAAPGRVFLQTGGADQIVWLPGEAITGAVSVLNAGKSAVQGTLEWSISSASGTTPQPAMALTLQAGAAQRVPLKLASLRIGDYTLHFRLMLAGREADRIDSPLRVLDPTLSRQPDQKIRVVNGAFTAGGRHVFLRGVNYWPRFVAGMSPVNFTGRNWLEAGQYDPEMIEADLSELAALNFNLVSIQYSDLEGFWAQEGRALIDFLERCRAHGIWVQIALSTTHTNAAYTGQATPTLESYIQAAYLPSNDRVFAYELLWEPMVGTHDKGGQGRLVEGGIVYNTGRTVLDSEWRAWVNEQYGSFDKAQQIWGFTAPLDQKGQPSNPLDEQIANDGPWRVMVAAYRRFLDDYLGRNLGVIARRIRRSDPDTLLGYRNWATMTAAHNDNTGYDIGAGAAHLDFAAPEWYSPALWPDSRAAGLITAYSRYRSGGKPVLWAEYGANVGVNGGTPVSRAAQGDICDSMMRIVADDGSNGASVWWWPGGSSPLNGGDFGIVEADGSLRPCAVALAQWNAKFAASAPDVASGSSLTLSVDRDADARGAYGLFLDYQDQYVRARQAGQSLKLTDAGVGTDTATMPVVQVGNADYSGSGPLKFANGEFGGIHVECPNLDVVVENGSTLAVSAGSVCHVTPTLVNTGEARWLAGSASKGVILRTNIGDAKLQDPLPSLQRTAVGPLTFTMGQRPTVLSGRMTIVGVGDFGEALNLALTVDDALKGVCPLSVSPASAIAVPAEGVTGTIKITTPDICGWTISADQPWITLSTDLGAGNGAVAYTIPAAYGPPRQGTISVQNYAFSVNQEGARNSTLVQAPALSASNLDFGARMVGTEGVAQSVRLANSGAGALSLQSINVGGSNSGDFAVTNDCGTSLAAGERCTIQVTFLPTAAGVRTASLSISGNFREGASSIPLSGRGIVTGPVPVIQAIVDSWGFTSGIAPGLWVTIGGQNLAGPPQTWNVAGAQALPVTLGATTVTFNGAPAALLYVSPTQINALVPASVVAGKAQVTVQVNGVSSDPFSIAAQAVQPAVYAPPNADGSTLFVTAALAGSATLIGNGATDPRVLRAAQPGDTLDLYMVGLGSTLDPTKFITDQLFSGAFPVSAKVSVSVSGQPADVVFAGLTSPGLYVVRIVVPQGVAAGSQALEVSAGGVRSRGSVVIQISDPVAH